MRYLLVLSLLIVAKIASAEGAGAAGNCAKYSAKLVSLQGALLISADGKGHWQPGQLNQTICQGSQVHVQPYSRASLILPSGIVLRMDEGTVLTINGIDPAQPTLLNLLKGFIHFISRTPRQLQIDTPIANAGPEGTEFALRVDDNNASLWVYEGAVRFYNARGNIKLKPGEAAQAQAGQAPQAKIDIKPQDAVNWALYYPPILPYPAPGMVIDSGIRSAIDDFRQGHSSDALTRLDKLSTAQQTPYFHKVRAAMRLTLGRVELAQQDINALLATNPKDADALALQSVMALTQNRKDEAYQLAQQAVTANPRSSTAYSALSYAEQGRFDLDKALEAAENAAKLAPNDALVWARKAELELSKGETSDSKQAAKKALNLDARLERTQTVMGFAHLISMDADDALTSFNQAIELDSTSPLARLGMGLAKIRNGDLEDGRKDLEIAAILDPNNSIVRSYLGKAYYEERRPKLADEQFKLAKERDPKDPTPYFYDAINKQTTNRPVEALHDMQKAIELNDNRGVYRSKLMLDSDSAARSASLGRIYNDLGFQKRGLLEGWNSINQDPSNYSAHRLLADNYVALPRHEIARVSELLKAQLLQPVNITPVQPQAAESNILILDGLGSNITSFNEYNPLFTRDRLALQATGFYGSNDTKSDEVVHSGVWNKFSYSLGQFHYQTHGYRPNNDLSKDVYRLFAQTSLAQDTDIQVELSRSEQENGDISQDYFPSGLADLPEGAPIEKAYLGSSLAKRQQQKNNMARVGLHHAFSSNSDLLMSFIFRDNSLEETDDDLLKKINGEFNIKNSFSKKSEGFKYELQHLFRDDYYDLTMGLGFFSQESNDTFNFADPNKPSGFSVTKSTNDLMHGNFYVYSNIKLMPKTIATVGLSQDFYDVTGLSSLNTNPLNPKFGFTWQPIKDTTVRFAAFSALKRNQLENQTLEPTQIAGFNQFFDDPDGTYSQRIGFGIDHKISDSTFIGIEGSHRIIKVPFKFIIVDGIQQFRKTRWYENNARGYINWSPNSFFSFGVDYLFEEFKRNKDFIDDTSNAYNGAWTYLKTHKTQIYGNYFHPIGFLAKLNLNYIDQSGDFFELNTELPPSAFYPNLSKNTKFWTVDAEIGYRFKNRHGLFTLGIKNLLNEIFNYQGTDFNQPSLQQGGRYLYGRLTLSF